MIEYERTNLNGVPDYTAVEFEGRRHDYCLLIPVINEGARILTEKQLSTLRSTSGMW